MMPVLSGRTALITGAGAGIGEGIARRFAEEGAHVVVAELDEESGRSVAASVDGLYVPMDAADRASVENAVAETIASYGSIDILVNNAWVVVRSAVSSTRPMPSSPGHSLSDTWAPSGLCEPLTPT